MGVVKSAGMKDCVELYAKSYGVKKVEAEQQIKQVLAVIKNVIIEKRKLTFIGSFTFKVAKRAESVRKVPKTGEVINVPSYLTVSTKIGKNFKEELNMK